MDVFGGLFSNVSRGQAQWRPAADKWSLLEVVNHLADEEVEDFGTRLRRVIEDPSQDWPAIDPQRWAIERHYNSRQPQESLDRFVRARNDTVAWLTHLPPIDWQRARAHPNVGAMKAGDLLHSWLAHDFIHIRQMNRLHYEYLLTQGPAYSVDYAGKW